jgi:hypothetical protein
MKNFKCLICQTVQKSVPFYQAQVASQCRKYCQEKNAVAINSKTSELINGKSVDNEGLFKGLNSRWANYCSDSDSE